MNTNAALLALIVDDDRAIRMLAAWASRKHKLADIDKIETDKMGRREMKVIEDLAYLTGIAHDPTKQILHRLVAAKVITDDGITELADKLLQTYVQGKLGGGKKR